jgi:hypothetical protein
MHRGIKPVPQLIYVSESDSKFFKELQEPKPLLTQCFCKNEKEKTRDLKILGEGGRTFNYW